MRIAKFVCYQRRSMKERAIQLDQQLFYLKNLQKQVATVEHAVSYDGAEWFSYAPTQFMYAYVAFNAVYSIDWNNSLQTGELSLFPKASSESDKFNKYLEFCFQDCDFVASFAHFFFNYITAPIGSNNILSELKRIQPDVNRVLANVYGHDFIMKFKNTCDDCISGRHFTVENIKTIVYFIYKIRCNVFHGVKGLDELNDERQQVRMRIYSAIILAVNQMGLSYLAYLSNDNKFTIPSLPFLRPFHPRSI